MIPPLVTQNNESSKDGRYVMDELLPERSRTPAVCLS
jgi:hypothetical protein